MDTPKTARRYPRFLDSAGKRFPWGLWAFIGFVGWIVVMIAIGNRTLALAAPAAGVICGWILGLFVDVLVTLLPRSRR